MPSATPPSTALVHVIIETGAKRVFASALEWPGWSRSGRDEASALDALASYAERYGAVARAAQVRFPAHPAFEIVERVTGNATTDFGASAIIATSEHEPPTAAEARRLAAILGAAWATLDQVVAQAPASLRKGPRGGGRDRDRVVEHVLGAEHAYAPKIGVRFPQPKVDDRAAIEAGRAAILEAFRAAAAKDAAETSWPVRYAARRITWHVLDHAWEIEDRSES